MSGPRRLAAVSLIAFLLLAGCADGLEGGTLRREGDFEYALPVNPYELEGRRLDRALDMAEAAGANTIVAGVAWWYVAPRDDPDSYRLGPMDRLVTETRRRGMRLHLQVVGTPDWVHPDLASRVPEHSRRIWHPPRDPAGIRAFGGFVRLLVERYGIRVERYEVWNEPNSADFWRPGPDPGEYAALLRAAYRGAEAANPRARVQFGGLSMNDAGYLTEYHEAARRYPDAEAHNLFFDVLGVHPYTRGGSPDRSPPDAVRSGPFGPVYETFGGISAMKSVMERQGDAHKEVFIGEFGYSTTETWMPAVPDGRRALYLKRAYDRARGLPYVVGMSWYAFVPGDTVGEEWTILDADLEPSLTYRALRQATGVAGPGAEVDLPVPRAPVSGEYLLRPDLTGAEEPGVVRWEVYVDGRLVAEEDRVPHPLDTRKLENGTHVLVVAAYTRDGSVWPSDPTPLEVSN